MSDKPTVTKLKNPGRVEAGKRLVEWNRNNKKKLKQPDKEPTQEPAQEPTQEPVQVPMQVPQDHRSIQVASAAGVLIAVALVYFLWRRKSTKPPAVVKPIVDDFR